MRYFDAHLVASPSPAPLAAELAGGFVFGAMREPLAGGFGAVGTLSQRIGTEDARFPRDAALLDLDVPVSQMLEWLRVPERDAEWWPLLNTVRTRKQFLRVPLAENAAPCVGLRRLAHRNAETCFLVDPFRFGPDSKWNAMIRMAEQPNIFLTTLGLLPGPACRWFDRKHIDTVLHFLSGEVGAGKVLLASGRGLDDTLSGVALEAWLNEASALDAAQRELIAIGNAVELGLTT